MTRLGNGEGTIFRRSDGRWVGEVYVLQPNGGRVRKTVYGRSREAVAGKIRVLLSQVASGIPMGSSWTVEAYAQYWLDNIGAETLRPSTFSSYRWILTRYVLPQVGKVKLSTLTPPHVRKMLAALAAQGLSAGSRRIAHAVLRSVLAEAVREELVDRNVATLVRQRQEHRAEVKPWSAGEATQFLKASRNDRLSALFVVGVAMGLRRGELIGLRWDDIDLDESQLRVQRSVSRIPGVGFVAGPPKSARSRRTLPLPVFCAEALHSHKARQAEERLRLGSRWEDCGYVFTSTTGSALDPTRLARIFQALTEHAGVRRIRLHDMRHTCASLLLAQQVPPRVVMEILGHSQLSMTMDLYSHVMPTALTDAATAVQRALDGY